MNKYALESLHLALMQQNAKLKTNVALYLLLITGRQYLFR